MYVLLKYVIIYVFLLSTTLLFTLGGSKYKIYHFSHRLKQSTNFLLFSHRGDGGQVKFSFLTLGERGGSRR